MTADASLQLPSPGTGDGGAKVVPCSCAVVHRNCQNYNYYQATKYLFVSITSYTPLACCSTTKPCAYFRMPTMQGAEVTAAGSTMASARLITCMILFSCVLASAHPQRGLHQATQDSSDPSQPQAVSPAEQPVVDTQTAAALQPTEMVRRPGPPRLDPARQGRTRSGHYR